MGSRWVGYVVRVVLSGALALGAFLYHQSASPQVEDAAAAQLTTLLTDPDAVRTPAVVESAVRETDTTFRRGRPRELHHVTGTVRTVEGQVLDFRHDLPTADAPSFDAVTDVVVVTSPHVDDDVWLLTDTSGALTNAGSVMTQETSDNRLTLAAIGLTALLFLGALRTFPRSPRTSDAPVGDAA